MATVRNGMFRFPGRTSLLSTLAVATLAFTACGTGAESKDGTLTVVASTDMWADVTKAVAGPNVEIETIIADNEADPHSYESTPRDAAKVDRADLVVYNGGGYDAFVPQLLSGTGGDKPAIAAYDVANESRHQHEPHGSGEHEKHSQKTGGHGGHSGGHSHGHHSGNEHVWYEPTAVAKVADNVAEELGRLRPEQSERYQQAADRFGTDLQGVQRSIDEIKAAHGGTEVLTTAPVADLMLERAGLHDITPPAFVQAVESGNDPAAGTVAQLRDMVAANRPALLVFNPQTASPLTERLRDQAESAGIPVVDMPESLPKDTGYTEWISDRVDALGKALDNSPTNR